MAGPQDHPNHCDDVTAAADKADFDVGQFAFTQHQRKEDADRIRANQETELHQGEDDDPHIADGYTEVANLAWTAFGKQSIANDAALLVGQPRHILRPIGQQPEQADADQHDGQSLDDEEPLPARNARDAIHPEQPA